MISTWHNQLQFVPSRASSFLLTFFAGCIAFLLFVESVSAQGVLPGETYNTNPKDRDISVTATVLPQGAPPAPILIEPHNNKILRSGVVLFQWQVTDHLSPYERFELHLNGQIRFGFIHTVNQETDDYILTYDSENRLYSLRLKPDKWLPDGVYTWKVRVIDSNVRGTDSTTWTFTVDSTAPPLIVTEIDDRSHAISASDPSTFPPEPIQVFDSSPLLRGKTEAASQVQIIIRYPDGTIWNTYTTTASGDGRFQVQIGTLPAATVMHVTITAVDLAANSTVLDAIDLIYQRQEFIIEIPDILPIPLTLRIRIPLTIRIRMPRFLIKDVFHSESIEQQRIEESDATVAYQPTEQIFTKPFVDTAVLRWGVFLFIFWYILAIFWLTGNYWKFFISYLRKIISLWIPYQNNNYGNIRVLHAHSGRELPFFALQISELQKKSSHKKQQFTSVQIVSNWLGWVQRSPLDQTLVRVDSGSGRFRLSSENDPVVVEPKYEPGQKNVLIRIVGEDIFWSSSAMKVASTRDSHVVVPLDSRLEFLFAPNEMKLVSIWMTWIPQIGLWLGVFFAVWLAFVAPTMIHFGLLIFFIWITIRDAAVRLRSQMEVYADK